MVLKTIQEKPSENSHKNEKYSKLVITTSRENVNHNTILKKVIKKSCNCSRNESRKNDNNKYLKKGREK